MKISVAVRTKFHMFELAQQLQNRHVLHSLYTSFYGKILGRDNRIGFSLDTTKIRQNYFAAALFYGFNLHKYPVLRYFGQWVAKQVTDEEMIVMFPMIALPILQKAKPLGIKTIISHASAHTVEHRKLLLEGYQQARLSTNFVETEFHTTRQEAMQQEYELVDYIQVPSTFVKNSFLTHGIPAHKILTIPLGVDLRFFYRKEIIAPKKFRLIYVGQLTIRKGVHILLQAFAQLRIPSIELCLVGTLTDELKPFLAKHTTNVTYLGVLSKTKLVNELAKSSVFVINSIEDGFAQVVPQAMACGLPVICTANVGGADLVENGQTGFVIPIHDEYALQEKIRYFYENPQEVIRMGYAAQQTVQNNYTWDIFGQKCFESYQQILQS